MDYICTVVGSLQIKELNLDLSYMEIVDFSSDDLKSTPQIRECIRNRQLEPYLASKHPNGKKFKVRNSVTKIIKENNDFSNISKNLVEVSERLLKALEKIDSLIDSFDRSKSENKEESNPTLLHSLLFKMDKFIDDKNKDSEKFDMLMKKIESLSAGQGHSYISKESEVSKKSSYQMDNIPIYVPEINISDVGNKNIKSQEVSSEGTDDILEKLKRLKNK